MAKDEQELNKKLAEYFGLEYTVDGQVTWIRNPDTGQWQENWLTRSLDACYRWIVPELGLPVILSSAKGTDGVTRYSCLIEQYDVHPSEYGVVSIEVPALALCLAWEKLNDSKERRIK